MWISVGVHLDHVFITVWTSRWRNAPRVWGGCACALGAFANREGNSLLRSPTQDHCGTTRLTPFKDKIKELCAFTVPCDFNPIILRRQKRVLDLIFGQIIRTIHIHVSSG